MIHNPVVTAFILSMAGSGNLSGSICGHEVTSVANLIDELTGADGGEIIVANPQIISIKDEARQRVWSIGKLSNAMPVVVCREVVKAGDRFRIDLHALCSGPEHECAAFIQQFRS
jgi:hypothetical protein